MTKPEKRLMAHMELPMHMLMRKRRSAMLRLPRLPWQVRLDDDRWVPFDDFAQAILRSAKAAGLPRSEVMSVGRRYDAWWQAMFGFYQRSTSAISHDNE